MKQCIRHTYLFMFCRFSHHNNRTLLVSSCIGSMAFTAQVLFFVLSIRLQGVVVIPVPSSFPFESNGLFTYKLLLERGSIIIHIMTYIRREEAAQQPEKDSPSSSLGGFSVSLGSPVLEHCSRWWQSVRRELSVGTLFLFRTAVSSEENFILLISCFEQSASVTVVLFLHTVVSDITNLKNVY